MMLRFLSSQARLSFSLVGIDNPAHEMMTSANSDASPVSTACRLTSAGLTLAAVVCSEADVLEVVNVRARRRKPPAADMKEDVDAGEGRESAEKRMKESGVVGVVGDLATAGEGRAGRAEAGATSLTMRASMKVRKVNETLWAGDGERVSNTQAWDSSVDRGGSLAFSRAASCCSISCQTLEVMIPSCRERRKAISVSDKISKR